MAYFFVEKTEGYTVMANHHLRDMRLSLKARGLLSQILSLPPKWDKSIEGLAKINRECSDTIANIIKELEAAGYITRYRERRDNGTFGEVHYNVYQKPRHFNPIEKSVENKPNRKKSDWVNPTSVKSGQLSKEVANKEKENKEPYNILSINLPDGIDEIEAYRSIVLENIEYDTLSSYLNKERLDEIVEIMLECICCKSDTQAIAKTEIPSEMVKSRMLKVHSGHIEYVFECLKNNPSKVRNIKSYLKTTLFNAPSTYDSYYTAEVNHDFYGTE